MENAERETQGCDGADAGRNQFQLQPKGWDCVCGTGILRGTDEVQDGDLLRMQFEAHYNGVLTNKISEMMETTMSRNDVWAVMLTATDGRVCRWEFWNCTLTHVKDLIRGYVESCPYDCDWTIRGGGMTIRGMSRQDDFGKVRIKGKIKG